MITLFSRSAGTTAQPQPAELIEDIPESIDPGYEVLAAIKSDAESKFGALEQALKAAHQAEQELFSLLFSEARGLAHPFRGDVAKQAVLARHTLRARAIELSQKWGWQLDPSFEVDGGYNHAAAEEGRYFTATRRTVGIKR